MSPCPEQIRNEHSARGRRRRGFTLLEVLVAVVLLATAFTIIWNTFATTIDGWRRSQDFLDRITHGDFVIDQLVSSVRSAAFFGNRPEKYGFWLDSRGGGDAPRDTISWVASGAAFVLPENPLSHGLYRIMLSVEDASDGSGLAVRTFPHMQEEIDPDDAEPWFVSPRVTGLDCKVYDFEEEDWKDEWENTNAVPSLVMLTVYLEPVDKNDPPVKLQRVVEIPVAPAVTGAVRVQQTPQGTGTNEPGMQVQQPSESQSSVPSGAGGAAGPGSGSPPAGQPAGEKPTIIFKQP